MKNIRLKIVQHRINTLRRKILVTPVSDIIKLNDYYFCLEVEKSNLLKVGGIK